MSSRRLGLWVIVPDSWSSLKKYRFDHRTDVCRSVWVPSIPVESLVCSSETAVMETCNFKHENACLRPQLAEMSEGNLETVGCIKSKIRRLAQLRVVLVNRLLFFVYVALVVLNLVSMEPGTRTSAQANLTIFEMLMGCSLFLLLELVLGNWSTPTTVSWHTHMMTMLNVALYSRLVVSSGTLASEVFLMGSLMSMGIMHLSTINLVLSLSASLGIAAGLYVIAPREDALLLICQLLLLGTLMSLLIHFFRKSSMEVIDHFLETTRIQTERLKSLVEQTRRDEERHRSISEALPLGMLEMTTEGYVMNGNHYLHNLFPNFAWGQENQPVLWSDMIHPQYRLEAEQDFNDAKSSNRCFLGEYCSTSVVNSGLVWLRFRLKLVSLRDETLYIGTVENVTCRKQIEQELMRYAEELRFSKEQEEAHAKNLSLLVDELAESRQRAEESTRTKSEFLANMSHEIRTPMTAILGYTDVVLEEHHTPAVAEYLSTIKRNGEYLLNLINDILDLSKIEAGKMDIEVIDCSPAVLVGEILSLLKNRATEKGLVLKASFEGELPATIQTDPVRLRQILVNLLGNAVKFTEQGSVEIITRLVWTTSEMSNLDLKQRNASLEFRIKDTGIGMMTSQLGLLFQPFTQADNSMTRRFGGTGLGLAISKRLANMLGGDIHVISAYGQGSEFIVTVSTGDLTSTSLARVPDIVFDQVCGPDSHPTSSTPHTHAELSKLRVIKTLTKPADGPELNCRVLLAEDGLDNQRLLTFLLKKAGCQTTVVDNGQAAVDEVQYSLDQGKPYDVILMDMQMPIMDGYSAATKLRQMGIELPIIALTAHAMTGDRDKCISAGCSDYLTKPVDKHRLYELIGQSIGHCLVH